MAACAETFAAGEEGSETIQGFVDHMARLKDKSRKAKPTLDFLQEADDDGSTDRRTPSLPSANHVGTWTQPQTLEEVRKSLGARRSPSFNRFVRNAGGDFNQPTYLRPKVLSTWETARAVEPERTYVYPKGAPGYHWNPVSSPIQEPPASLCGELHQKWMKKHDKLTDKAKFPIFYALEELDEALRNQKKNEQKRMLTRDILSRAGARTSPVGGGWQAAQKLVGTSLRSSTALLSLTNNTETRNAEEAMREQARVDRAKSSPVLRLGSQRHPLRARHLQPWKTSSPQLRDFTQTYPTVELDEAIAKSRDLHGSL
eukprot:TRINITY_DN58001_c0_g1_i1.p1 TRINITY_DN58001_c0_g1~~TRINITY_DN58001_c0_g1_i1.p1  ORF type:complete len:341 (-),score=45.03 TRINITY_DN58001_c0_g1_i1:130-1071(-)